MKMDRIKCEICPRACRISEGQKGACGARINKNSVIIPVYYGKVSALALDPIEKKPLYEFHPGTKILSAGSLGCNLICPFCQNHDISQLGDYNPERFRTYDLSPDELVSLAMDHRQEGNIGIAFTYNEPLINWEYLRDTAQLAKAAGLYTVLVSNGSASLGILEEILPFMDAMNIDLKGFRQDIYDIFAGNLETVKSFIERAVQKAHVEVTSLIVPGLNDSKEDMEAQTDWLYDLCVKNGKSIPLHLTRFFPRYKMQDRPPTDIGLLRELKAVACKKLKSVYLGNI